MTIPLFDLPEPTTRAAGEPTGRRQTPKTPDPDRITWASYKPKKRIPCDNCLADLIAAGGGPLARDARWRRRQHGTDQVYCHHHADLQHQLDGRGRLPGGGTK